MLFVLISSLTVMNMLVGILVEIISVISTAEKEEMQVGALKNEITNILDDGADQNQDNLISKEEFLALLMKPKARNALHNVGVDVVGLVDFADFLFHQVDGLSFTDFMTAILELRGSNTATVKDMVDQRKFFQTQWKLMDTKMDELRDVALAGQTISREKDVQSKVKPIPTATFHYQSSCNLHVLDEV